MSTPFVVWLHAGYVMVHRSDCRHLKNRRPDDKRFVDIQNVEAPGRAHLLRTVCYCRDCKPREVRS